MRRAYMEIFIDSANITEIEKWLKMGIQDGVPGYGVMHQLEGKGIKVNATVALSLGQVILAAKAGATYISIFAGRVADEGGNAPELIARAADRLERWHYI